LIREERKKEVEDRIKGAEEDKEEVKNVKGKAVPVQKPPPKNAKDLKGKEPIPEGGIVEVSQYTITPA
jgi:hypothetical protein